MTKPLSAGPPVRPTACRLAGPLLLAALALAPAPARAQDDPRLQDALRLAQEGASDSARALVGGLLRVTPPTDTLYPQVLYTMGLVSRSVEDMRRTYTRIAVEYANSSWADDAVYRLGLLDYAAGNVAGAVQQMNRLRNDYPGSPLIPTASEWAARALFDQKKPRDACDWIATGLARSGDDVELRNRLQFLNGRCSGPALADTSRPDTTRTTQRPDSSRPPARTGFGVQVGAVNSQAAADKLADGLKAAGFTPYVVKEGPLFKVRAGPYPDRNSATTALARVRSKLGGAPFLVQEP